MILRGLRERTKELKQKAATTFGNICALVDDTRDLLPFIPVLLPELEKAEEHSHPDSREAAAKASLMKGIDSTQNDERKVASDIVQRAIEEAGVRVDGETQAYAAALGGWVMDFGAIARSAVHFVQRYQARAHADSRERARERARVHRNDYQRLRHGVQGTR